MSTITGTVTIIGEVQTGRISPWQDYAIEKRKLVMKDGRQRTYYEVLVDGDAEGVELTLRQARQYVKDLKDSYFENHPDENPVF